MTTIYVGNLSFAATQDELGALFERHGKVEWVSLINDLGTRPHGFAFVDVGSDIARTAIQQTNGFHRNGHLGVALEGRIAGRSIPHSGENIFYRLLMFQSLSVPLVGDAVTLATSTSRGAESATDHGPARQAN